MRRIVLLALFFIVLPGICLYGQHVFHVSVMGNDNNSGSKSRPLRTISAAARLAQPGDIITVHQGVYRERIDPPRGGISDTRRIIYQAAQGEKVEIKGSEIIRNWRKIDYDTWKAVIPNSFFGDFNPFRQHGCAAQCRSGWRGVCRPGPSSRPDFSPSKSLADHGQNLRSHGLN